MLFFVQGRKLSGFIFILLLANISAECNETQININSAPAEELDKIINVGPTIAEKIIEGRPFDSVDGLIDIRGIGNTTLNEIKQEGLACVENSRQEEGTSIEEEHAKNDIPAETISSITLNAKSIKSEESTEFSSKNLAFLGVIAFSVIFGALFLIKKRKYKNEFN